jgi:hypothetical protein
MVFEVIDIAEMIGIKMMICIFHLSMEIFRLILSYHLSVYLMKKFPNLQKYVERCIFGEMDELENLDESLV